MSDSVYIRPIGIAPGPQSEHGNAIRLAGGMVYASRFAVILRREGEVVERFLAAPDTIAQVLGELPDCVGAEAEAQWTNLRMAHTPLEMAGRTIRLDQPQIAGILNVTPDSFSDGGRFLDDADNAREYAAAMLEAGAALLDIGGESTRPGAKPVWEGDEIARVTPAIEACAKMGAAISIDTRKSAVMEAALAAGAAMVNDVSGLLHDDRSAGVVAAAGCPVVLMFAPGAGKDNLHDGEQAYGVLDVFDALRGLRDHALEAGIARQNIVLDPGIGFGMTLAQSTAIINALPMFHALGHPLMLGASRKRLVGAMSNEAPVDRRLAGSIALALAGMGAGVQLLRVHDVPATVQARNVWRGLRDAALTDFADLPG